MATIYALGLFTSSTVDTYLQEVQDCLELLWKSIRWICEVTRVPRSTLAEHLTKFQNRVFSRSLTRVGSSTIDTYCTRSTVQCYGKASARWFCEARSTVHAQHQVSKENLAHRNSQSRIFYISILIMKIRLLSIRYNIIHSILLVEVLTWRDRKISGSEKESIDISVKW